MRKYINKEYIKSKEKYVLRESLKEKKYRKIFSFYLFFPSSFLLILFSSLYLAEKKKVPSKKISTKHWFSL